MDQIRKSAKKDEIATAMVATMHPFDKLLQQLDVIVHTGSALFIPGIFSGWGFPKKLTIPPNRLPNCGSKSFFSAGALNYTNISRKHSFNGL